MTGKYWDIMTPQQRSAEMSRRRAKARRPAGGIGYMDKKRRSELGKLGATKRWHNEANSLEEKDSSKKPSQAKETT